MNSVPAHIFVVATCAGMLVQADCAATESSTVEMCLSGEFDLAARLQGMRPEPGEFYPASWCVVTEDDSGRVQFSGKGRSNPDTEGQFTVSYFPPDRVRIVQRDSPPDIEFADAAIVDEARRSRRLDPRRLIEELRAHPDRIVGTSHGGRQSVRYPGSTALAHVRIEDGRLRSLATEADLPLRGRVPVEWDWQWSNNATAAVTVRVDGAILFRAQAVWRTLSPKEAAAIWALSDGETAREVPGDAWPARVSMQIETLADGVHMVRGVRTGFHHLVVETDAGLVIGDAPAGWVELHQIPPADLVPGLGISGLSEAFIDFLTDAFPGISVRAVALTHVHDDHAGGARAFAAAGAEVFAPAAIVEFLDSALNRPELPPDRFDEPNATLEVSPVRGRVLLGDRERPVELIELGAGPHVGSALGVYVRNSGYFFQSDLHVPNSHSDEPRPERALTECWFAGWAATHLPEDTIVLSSHGTIRSPVSRLKRYLDSERCR